MRISPTHYDLPDLVHCHHRVWEAPSINHPPTDAEARVRNPARAQASARSHPKKGVAEDEGVFVHRRFPADRGKHFVQLVRITGLDRFIEAPIGPITVEFWASQPLRAFVYFTEC